MHPTIVPSTESAPENCRPPVSAVLTVCALTSFALALLHVVCLFTGEATARFFTAPPVVLALIRQKSLLIFPVCLVIAGTLGIFGLYAWAGAGRMRPLPLLRTGLVAVGVIYTLRGLALVPQVLVALRRPGLFPSQVFVFSAVALGLGLAHLLGSSARWPALKPAG